MLMRPDGMKPLPVDTGTALSRIKLRVQSWWQRMSRVTPESVKIAPDMERDLGEIEQRIITRPRGLAPWTELSRGEQINALETARALREYLRDPNRSLNAEERTLEGMSEERLENDR